MIKQIKNKVADINTIRFFKYYSVANTTIGDNIIFKINKSKLLAQKSLKTYLKLGRTKRNIDKKETVPQVKKRINQYKLVAVKALNFKLIYYQYERWQDNIKGLKKLQVKGFDDLSLARKWLDSKKK